MADFSSLWLSIALGASTTAVLLLLCTPLAWWLAKTKTKAKPFIEAIFSLPLVLPPTVLGFYLLLLLNDKSAVGQIWISITGEGILFSFTALLIGSVIYSLPFALRPIQNAFESLDKKYIEAAATLGATPADRFFSITLPLCRHGILSSAVMCFAHTLGEFGVVLMVGGNIPGKTRTISITIYDYVEQLKYAEAHQLAATLLALSFAMLTTLYTLNRKARFI